MLMRTDPFRDLDRFTQQVLGTTARPATMPIDAYRQGEEFVVHFDLPGVNSDQIELDIERNVLTVKAERTSPAADDVEMVVAERPRGTFSRQLFLGETLDPDRVTGSYDSGVLTLRIPIAEQAKPRKIQITSENAAQQIKP